MHRHPIIAGFATTLVLVLGAGFVSTHALDRLIRPDGAVASIDVLASATGPSAFMLPTTRRTVDQYLDPVMCKNLFDKGARDACMRGGTVRPARASRLAPDIVLLGTVVATPAAFSSALIVEDGKDKATGYGVGDTIDGRRVVDIAPKQVTLERHDGKREVLVMAEDFRGR